MLKKILLSVLAIFGLTFLSSSNSYAASDVVFNIDGSNTVWNSNLYFCTSSSNPTYSPYFCQDYKYIIFNFTDNSSMPVAYYTVNSSLGNFQLLANSSKSVISLNDNIQYVRAFGGSSDFVNNYPNSGFTVTLTDSLGGIFPEGTLDISSNGTYDVTSYASVSVDIDSELPPYSQIVVDSFWKYHVAIAGGLSSIFAIFVVYRIIRSRLR